MAEPEYGPGQCDSKTCGLRFFTTKIQIPEIKLERRRQNGKGKKKGKVKKRKKSPIYINENIKRRHTNR